MYSRLFKSGNQIIHYSDAGSHYLLGKKVNHRSNNRLKLSGIQITVQKTVIIPSRGGLEVEAWTDNSLHSASVGSNLCQVWCINRSVEETIVQPRSPPTRPRATKQG